MLAFLDYYGPIDDLFKACHTWSVLDLHVGEIHVLLVSHFIIYDPHATQKASVGMYNGCDYLFKLSLKILFVYFLAL